MGHSAEVDKRQQILKAAVKIFSQKGFHEAKVDEIAQLADVGKGTVYEYFSSKTELFQEMFKAGMDFYIENVKNELKPKLSSKEKLLKIARLHSRFIVKYRDLARITMTEHTYFNEDFRKWIWENRVKKLELIRQIIDQGIESGEFRSVDSYATALVFMGALGSLFPPIVFARDKSSYKGLLDPVMDIIFNGLENRQ